MKSLKELREYNNLTQKEVAQHIGVSNRVYSYYEKGRTLPAKYVKPLANLFGVSCDEFLENNTDALDWEKEFGNIVRTERLVLPTWEELKNILQTQKYFEVNFKNKYETVSFCVNECQIAVVQQGHNYLSGLDKEFNKENYILACRKAKELFLGEKK